MVKVRVRGGGSHCLQQDIITTIRLKRLKSRVWGRSRSSDMLQHTNAVISMCNAEELRYDDKNPYFCFELRRVEGCFPISP